MGEVTVPLTMLLVWLIAMLRHAIAEDRKNEPR